MPRCARPLLLAALLACAAGLTACGSSHDSLQDGGSAEQPPLTSTRTAAPQTTSTVTTTPTTTTQPPATTPTTTTPRTVTTTPPTTTSPAQATGGAPAGCPGATGGFIRNVQARGTDCGRAHDVVDGWFRAVHEGTAPDAPISAAGYSCAGQMAGERASVTCSAGGGTVTFTASP